MKTIRRIASNIARQVPMVVQACGSRGLRGILPALVCTLVLAGCASVPLGTLWRLRNFSPQDLYAVKPAQVRLAGRVDPTPLRIDATRSGLVLKLTPRASGAAQEVYRFGLRASVVYDPRLVPDAGDGGRRWQVFALDDAGVAAWNRLRPKLKDIKQQYRAASFAFRFETDRKPGASVRALVVSARLQLAPEQAPLVLLDDKSLPIDRN